MILKTISEHLNSKGILNSFMLGTSDHLEIFNSVTVARIFLKGSTLQLHLKSNDYSIKEPITIDHDLNDPTSIEKLEEELLSLKRKY